MTDRIFIDANIYLRLYEAELRETRTLISTLLENRKFIFVTTQIAHEVVRNRTTAFLRSVSPYIRKLSADVPFPSLLAGGTDDSERRWKALQGQAKDVLDRLAKEYERLIVQTAERLSSGSDNVSTQLHQLFDGAAAESQEVSDRARRRREFGEPPGKKDDPLGDQISWEQFLEVLRPGDKIWVATADSDFYYSVGKAIFLHPTLMTDITRRKVRSQDVYLFNDLLQTFKSFKELTHKHVTLPDEKTQRTISEEGNVRVGSGFLGASEITSAAVDVLIGGWSNRFVCPKCHQFVRGLLKSQDKVLIATCEFCGATLR